MDAPILADLSPLSKILIAGAASGLLGGLLGAWIALVRDRAWTLRLEEAGEER